MAETTYDRTKPQKRFTAAVSRGLRESAVLAHRRHRAGHARRAAVLPPRRLRRSHRRAAGERAVGNLIGPFGALAVRHPVFPVRPAGVSVPRDAGRGLLRDVPAARRRRRPHAREHRGAHRRFHAHAVRELRTRHAALERRHAARNRGRRGRPVRRHRPRRAISISSAPRCSCSRPGWRACRWPSASPGSPSSTRSAPASGTASAGSRPAAARRATSPSASKPRRRASKRPRSKRSASPRA